MIKYAVVKCEICAKYVECTIKDEMIKSANENPECFENKTDVVDSEEK